MSWGEHLRACPNHQRSDRLFIYLIQLSSQGYKSSLVEALSSILHVFLVLLLLQVLLKPGDQVPSRRKLLVVEVEPRTTHLYQLSDRVTVLEHVDQEDELRIVLSYTEIVVDVTIVLLRLSSRLVLYGLDGD